MKFIKPSVEIITEPDLFKRIEIAARTCYKSESKRTDESAQKMISALIKRGHESPLEHSNIVVKCDDNAATILYDRIEGYELDTGLSHFIKVSVPMVGVHLFSGNLRAWRSIVKYFYGNGLLAHMFHGRHGFEDIEMVTDNTDYGEFEFVDPYNSNLPGCNHIITARFICDRGVSHELVRHRCLSFSQESTRYVNYQEGLVLVEPWWWPEQETSDTQFIRASCQAAEDAYCSMIKSGCSPQKARCVLPNMLKTEVVATGTIEQWQKLVLPLRLSKAAHPDIRRLMELFCEQLGWDPNDFRK